MIATPTILETEIVFGAVGGFGVGVVRELLQRLNVEPCAFEFEYVLEAKVAYARLGKGTGHPTRWDGFGDCVSCLLAKVEGAPLAFTGDGFDRTDLDVVNLG